MADGGPGLRGVGDQGEAALVDEYHYRSSEAGFCLYRGQERCRQFLTARRSFSRACRRGRCQESPWRLSRRHMAVRV